MLLDPLQMLAAFVAACIVLAIARVAEGGPFRFSLRSLLLTMTVAAVILGLFAYVLR